MRCSPLLLSVVGGLRSCAAALLLCSALSAPVRAGGPVGTIASGDPLRWDASQPVRYAVGTGTLGDLSHDAAVTLVQQALKVWQDVPTARLRIEAAPELTRPINGRNVVAFLSGLRTSDPSPILLDNDGSITDALQGQGASEAVFAFAGPLLGSRSTGEIKVSFAVLNGLGEKEDGSDHYLLVCSHELGHFLGLQHSLVNARLKYGGDPTNDPLTPQMFYRGPNGRIGLHADDQAWYSWLYPTPDFTAGTGTIRGRVLLPDGRMTGLQGIHVIARRQGDPLVTAVGCYSGYVFRNSGGGGNDPARLGEFIIPGLPPGSYTVEVEQVEQLPGYPDIQAPTGYLVGGPKFWHTDSSAQDSPTASSVIPVNAGQAVSGIDIVLNGDTLGAPKPVQKSGPNALPNAQVVRVPAVISGQVDDGTGNTTSHDIQSPSDLQDVYRVALGDWTVVTAILSAADRGADLDLYVLGQDGNSLVLEAASILNGTPPEVIQLRLPPGRHYFGVRRAGPRGTAYTLQLLASPAPDPDQPPVTAYLGYLLLGNVTKTSATAHWSTTDDTPTVLYYNVPQQETGSPKLTRQHDLALTGLAAAQRTEVDVFAQSDGGVDQLISQLTTATDPASDGSPRIVATSSAVPLDNAGDIVMIASHINNRGDAGAHTVRIEQIVLPAGWLFLWEAITGQALPATLDVGDIGAGGAGAFVAVIGRRSGTADPHITVHGSYTDAAGTPMKF